MLEASIDPYNGVIINPKKLPNDEIAFGTALERSLERWRVEGRRGVWLTVPVDKAPFLPLALEMGFKPFQCDERGFILNYWLPKTKNTLPQPVSSFLVNDKNQLLVVQEGSGPAAKKLWKLPGGTVDQGEYIHDAAVREVYEETGIKTEFVSMVAMRQMANARWGKMDLYFVCLLRPLSSEIKIQQEEIHAAKWIDLDEYVKTNLYPPGVYRSMIEFAAQAHYRKVPTWTAELLPMGFKVGDNAVYGPAPSPKAKL